MALRLVELLTDTRTAQAVQLWTEYDPMPPFDAGSPARAPADVVELAAEFEAAALEAAMRSGGPRRRASRPLSRPPRPYNPVGDRLQ